MCIRDSHCTAVLCTATQPALKDFFPDFMKAEEICPNVKGQYEFFKRTEVINIGEISEEDLISYLEEKDQVLCVLNSRKRVQRVFESLKGEDVYHLSTYMYPCLLYTSTFSSPEMSPNMRAPEAGGMFW